MKKLIFNSLLFTSLNFVLLADSTNRQDLETNPSDKIGQESNKISIKESYSQSIYQDITQLTTLRSHYSNPKYFEAYSKFAEDVFLTLCARDKWLLYTSEKLALFNKHRPILTEILTKQKKAGDSFVLKDSMAVSSIQLELLAEKAVDRWHNSPFREEINYNAFREGLLPYFAIDEALEDWELVAEQLHSDTLNNIKSAQNLPRAYDIARQLLDSRILSLSIPQLARMPRDKRLSIQSKLNLGNCYDETIFQTLVMRSAGIPTSPHYIASWGNRMPATHSWAAIPFRSFENKITNENTGRNTNFVVGASSFDHIDWDLTPSMLEKFIFNKYIPKIYRKNYFPGRIIAPMGRTAEQIDVKQISEYFDNSSFIDVTSDFILTADVKLEAPQYTNLSNKEYFLGLFDRDIWHPVAYATNNGPSIVFKDVGINIIYILMVQENGKPRPIGNPFLNTKNGIRFFTPKPDTVNKVLLERKCPMFANTAMHYYSLSKANISLSNNQTFKNALETQELNQKFEDMHSIKLGKNDYRFMRFMTKDPNRDVFIGELELFYSGTTMGVLTSDQLMALGSPGKRYVLDPLFDGDYSTFGEIECSTIMELNLPEGCWLSGIRILPRSDTNFIIPDRSYELSYFDNGWNVIGTSKAVDFNIEFENVPDGALLWLKCIDDGIEERPFEMVRGRQFFY